jgi:hypothetical protein
MTPRSCGDTRYLPEIARCPRREWQPGVRNPTERHLAAINLRKADELLGDHIHLDVTDLNNQIRTFVRAFQWALARVLNGHWGRWEYFWAPSSSGMQRVVTARDAALGMLYTIANPVSAGWLALRWVGQGRTRRSNR